MRTTITLAAVAALTACGAMPVKGQTQKGFFQSDGFEFAIFAEGGRASAIRVGDAPMGDLPRRAVAAIQLATGCRVIPESLAGTQKSIQAEYTC